MTVDLILLAALVDLILLGLVLVKVNTIAGRVDRPTTVPTANAERFGDPPTVIVVNIGDGPRRYMMIGKERTAIVVRSMTVTERVADGMRRARAWIHRK